MLLYQIHLSPCSPSSDESFLARLFVETLLPDEDAELAPILVSWVDAAVPNSSFTLLAVLLGRLIAFVFFASRALSLATFSLALPTSLAVSTSKPETLAAG